MQAMHALSPRIKGSKRRGHFSADISRGKVPRQDNPERKFGALAAVNRSWIRYLSRRKEVRRAILFGSRARGDNQRCSDIDLAISAPRISERRWLEIYLFFQEESPTLLSVDVVRWENAPRALKKRIAQEGQVLYERQ